MSDNEKLSDEVRQLAAMAYGESSTRDDAEEMSALASVLVRQRDARGYTSISTFASSDRTFSFVVNDGNPRYKRFRNSSDDAIAKDGGMRAAVAAARNALAGGPDLSNGAYFWDGEDIKTKYQIHFKVRHGIRFSKKYHNIFGINESRKLVILNRTIVKKQGGKEICREEVEIGRYDHVYVSTAAYGSTIFWKNNDEYMKVTRAKEYK
jgi:hypothetical protein